jgi:hypothetical protein
MPEINASALAHKLDAPESSWTPETLHQTFLKFGCAVVRGGVDREVQRTIRAAVDVAYQGTSDAHVYDKDISKASEGRLSGWELVDTALLQNFLALTFSGQEWRRAYIAARRIQGVRDNPDWQRPLELHLDSQFHGFDFTVNFWVPFDRCGVDAPSLQLIPLSYQKTREYSQYTGELLREGEPYYFGYFRSDIVDPSAAIEAFGPECFLRPAMEPGDVIVSSNWIIHGSHRTPDMEKGRMNAELRFIGSKLDIETPYPNAVHGKDQ